MGGIGQVGLAFRDKHVVLGVVQALRGRKRHLLRLFEVLRGIEHALQAGQFRRAQVQGLHAVQQGQARAAFSTDVRPALGDHILPIHTHVVHAGRRLLALANRVDVVIGQQVVDITSGRVGPDQSAQQIGFKPQVFQGTAGLFALQCHLRAGFIGGLNQHQEGEIGHQCQYHAQEHAVRNGS